MATCYRHSNRETGVSCSNCGNPICPDCMTTTPVGMRCPDCSAQKTKVVTMGSIHGQPTATYVLMALNVLIYLGSRSGGQVIGDYALWGNSPQFGGGIAEGELYRLVTSGFLHASLLHLAFNMYALYWLGNLLEPVMRTPKFVALYFASMLVGSFGAILLHPEPYTLGASGAVFGLFAAAFLSERERGFDPMASGIGPTILLNLAITFFPGLNISIGGHLGGLAGGALAFWLMSKVRGRRSLPLELAVCVAVGAAAVAAAVAVSDRASGLF